MAQETAGRIQFDSITNFRDIAPTTPHLKPGLLYRSSRPDAATPSDQHRLLHELKIKTIIDLRTPTEHLEQAKKLAATSAPGTTSTRAAPATNAPNRIEGIDYVSINFNGPTYTRALISQLPYHSTAKLGLLYALGWRKDAISILAKAVIAPRGLTGLAEDSLKYCRAEIKSVFDILCDPARCPVVVHCTQGKDRTGLIVALMLWLCGVEVEAVEADYLASGPELAKERAEKVAEVRSIGLPDGFADCEVGWAGKVKGFVEREYGGVEQFLLGCGVTLEQVEKLKAILMAPR